ncbi:MAG: hypothetical protein RLZZ565_1357 [Planctomycetota bacterium]
MGGRRALGPSTASTCTSQRCERSHLRALPLPGGNESSEFLIEWTAGASPRFHDARAMPTSGSLAKRRLSDTVPRFASVAQLVEQLTLNQRVLGSSPSGGMTSGLRSGPGGRRLRRDTDCQFVSSADRGCLSVRRRDLVDFADRLDR